jgi:hypothetical protein
VPDCHRSRIFQPIANIVFSLVGLMVLALPLQVPYGKKETPSMFLAIAALFLQFSPSVQAVPIAATVPVATAGLARASASHYVVSAAMVADRAPAERSFEGTTATASALGGSWSDASSALSSGTPQNSQSFSTVRIPDFKAGKMAARIGIERLPSRRNWIILSAVQHGAAGFDAYSTLYATSRGAVEDDPFMRPFAHSAGIYAAIQVAPFVLDYAARRMQRSQSNLIRHIWWIPQSASTVAYLFSGSHNFRVANRP